MARAGIIRRWPPELRAQLEQLVSQGKTIAEIVDHLRAINAPQVSAATIGRFKQRQEQQLQRYKDARAVAGVWEKTMREAPESDMGQLLVQLLSTVTFATLGDVEQMDPKDIAHLGRAIKDLSSAQRLSTENVARALAKRQEQLEKQMADAAKQIDAVAKPAGLSDDTIAKMHAALKGAIA